jgi:hypothetical protein
MDPRFLTWTLVGCEWLVLRRDRFTPGEIGHGTSYIRPWLDQTVERDDMEKILDPSVIPTATPLLSSP